MSQTEIEPGRLPALVTGVVLGEDFRRATFAGALRGDGPWPWLRVVVRPVRLRGERLLQFSYFDRTKNVTKNHAPADAAAPLREIVAAGYAGIHLSAGAEEIDIQTTKKGKV